MVYIRLLLGFFLHLFWKRTFGDKWHGFSRARHRSCHPSNDVKALKGTRITDSKQGKLPIGLSDLFLSWSTTAVTPEGRGVTSLLPGVRYSDASMKKINTIRYRHHHNRFTALFPGPPGWAGARTELLDLDFMVQGKINRGRHTDHPAGRHSIRTNQCPPPPSPIFYRPDALPAAQPTMSKHWRQLAHSH